MDYLLHLGILVTLYLILAQGLNITFGLGRMFNLAHVALYAIGAYTTALLSTEFSYSPLVCIPASLLLSSLLALLIGGISLKLSQDYFAIGTIAFSAVISALLINWKSLTRGVLGIPGIPRPILFNVELQENYYFLFFSGVACILTSILSLIIFKSPFARKLRAQAEFETASEALGINTVSVRIYSFVLSSLCAGLAGSLFAYYLNYIDPTSFTLNEMVFVLSIVIVGRPGSYWGVIAATFFLVLLPEPLRFLDIPSSVLGPMRQMLYAFIVFAVVLWKKEAIFPSQRRI